MAAPEDNYKTTGNLTRRGDFNGRFGNFSWFGWVAEHVAAPTGRVLDIGCGPGWFWKRQARQWQPAHLTLADTSEAMLSAARTRLAEDFPIDTQIADVASLPFDDASFDDVFAMHMLYHSRDPARALREIARVLKPDGRAIITTVNDRDLQVMADLSRQVFGSSGTDLIMPVFGTARATDLLPQAFASLTRHACKDTFAVDDTEAALDYICSFPPGTTADDTARGAFRDAFDAMRQKGGGVVQMDRLQDLFIATGPRT